MQLDLQLGALRVIVTIPLTGCIMCHCVAVIQCILADSHDCYHWTYEDCAVFSPGAFADKTNFVVYHPATRVAEISAVEEDTSPASQPASQSLGGASRGAGATEVVDTHMADDAEGGISSDRLFAGHVSPSKHGVVHPREAVTGRAVQLGGSQSDGEDAAYTTPGTAGHAAEEAGSDAEDDWGTARERLSPGPTTAGAARTGELDEDEAESEGGAEVADRSSDSGSGYGTRLADLADDVQQDTGDAEGETE